MPIIFTSSITSIPDTPLWRRRISGTVQLHLTSNPVTGETERVTIVSGNPLLAQTSKESAQHWRFVPGPDTALSTTSVVLEFVFHCP